MSTAPNASEAGLEEAFNAARAQQAEGNLDEAKRRYGQILVQIPHHAESMTMLASIAYQQGDDTQAQAYVERAIQVYQAVLERMPALARVRAPLVNLLQAQNRMAEAERYIESLELRINPIRATPREFTQRRRICKEKGLPAMLINTVPKSASESIWNKIAESLTMAQGHLSIGLFPDCLLVPIRVRAACEGGLIAKEHLLASPFNLKVLAGSGLTKVVCHLRDPRQATLSWAHFVRDDVSMRLLAPIWRKIVPPASLDKHNLEALLDWCIDSYLPQLIEFTQSWVDADQDPEQPVEVLFQSFEAFRTEPGRYYEEVLDFYGVSRAHFTAESEAEVVHLRKGLIEEWREVMTSAQQARAAALIPANLSARFGWAT